MSLLAPKTKTTSNPVAAAAIEKAGQTEMVRLNIEVPEELRHKIKARALAERMTVKEWLTKTILEGMDK